MKKYHTIKSRIDFIKIFKIMSKTFVPINKTCELNYGYWLFTLMHSNINNSKRKYLLTIRFITLSG